MHSFSEILTILLAFQDTEISTYGGRNSEKTLLIMKLRADLQNLQSLNEDANTQLLERDKQIADLQACFRNCVYRSPYLNKFNNTNYYQRHLKTTTLHQGTYYFYTLKTLPLTSSPVLF